MFFLPLSLYLEFVKESRLNTQLKLERHKTLRNSPVNSIVLSGMINKRCFYGNQLKICN